MIDAVLLFTSVYVFMIFYAKSPLLPLDIAVIVLTFAYALLSLNESQSARTVHWKTVLIFLILGCTVVFSQMNSIYIRQQNTAPLEVTVHDYPLANEAAVEFLLAGKNPYTEDYTQTQLVQWNPQWRNPALYHMLSLPFAFIKSIPLYLIWQPLFSWYDDRLSHLVLYVMSLWAVYALFSEPLHKLTALIAFGLNPLFVPYFIEGRNDIVVLSLIIIAVFLLKKGKVPLSLIVLGLAATTKHTSWFIIVFFLSFLYYRGYFQQHPLKKIAPLGITVALVMAPFIIWDWHSLYKDIYAYPSGLLATSYPIKGYGISPVLVGLGVIEHRQSYFPFGIVQAVFVAPLLIWLLWRQKKHNSHGDILLNGGLLTWAFFFFARFFNENYIGAIASVLALGALLIYEEKEVMNYMATRQLRSSSV